MKENWQALALFMKGLSLFQSGKRQEALAAFNQAIEQDATFARPWNGKGYVLGVEGRYREALDAYDRAIELDPTFAYAWNGKGYMLGAEGRYQEALDAYRRAVELDPTFAFPWSGMGNTWSAMGQYEKALEAYGRAAVLDSTFALPWYGRAVLLKAQPGLESRGGPSAQQSFCRAVYLRQTHAQQFPLSTDSLLDMVGEFRLPLLARRLLMEAGVGAEGCAAQIRLSPQRVAAPTRESASPVGAEPLFGDHSSGFPILATTPKGSPHAALFERIMKECEAPLRMLEALDSNLSLNPQEKLLSRGMVYFEHGDPLCAFECFDAVDSADETNLASQYYLVLSLKDYGEPADKELAFALSRAESVLQQLNPAASAGQLYYAGRLFSLAGQPEKAALCLSRGVPNEDSGIEVDLCPLSGIVTTG